MSYARAVSTAAWPLPKRTSKRRTSFISSPTKPSKGDLCTVEWISAKSDARRTGKGLGDVPSSR
jgi:hypothetical protein